MPKALCLQRGFTGCGKFLSCLRARLQPCRKCSVCNGALAPEVCFFVSEGTFSAACLAAGVRFFISRGTFSTRLAEPLRRRLHHLEPPPSPKPNNQPRLDKSPSPRPRSSLALQAGQATSPPSKSLFRRLCTKKGDGGVNLRNTEGGSPSSPFSFRNRQPHPPKPGAYPKPQFPDRSLPW